MPKYYSSHFNLSIVCPGWVIGNLEALAGAKPGHILAGMFTGIPVLVASLN